MVDKRFFVENAYVYLLNWEQKNVIALPNRPEMEECELIVCNEQKARETYADFKRDEIKKKLVCNGLFKVFADGRRERIA